MKKNVLIPLLIIVIILLIVVVIKNQKKGETTPVSVSDIEGNVYKTVKIGDQWWMAENLKTTKYSDGSAIPNIPDSIVWPNLSTPAYCLYNNETSNKNKYGALYNWYAVSTGKLCPAHWRVPNNYDWVTLTTFLGGLELAGPKMKADMDTCWGPDSATNSSGFIALPSGLRNYQGSFLGKDFISYWWCSKDITNQRAYLIGLNCDTSDVAVSAVLVSGVSKKSGLSVRCIKIY